MKVLLLTGVIALSLIGCQQSVSHRDMWYEQQLKKHSHSHCNDWAHHDHDDQHGGSYWHTHCLDYHK